MPHTILLIEDYADTRRAYKALLERHGYRVLDAGTGREARIIFREEPIDLIISDIGLPDCFGYDLLIELHESQNSGTRNTPAIAVSGLGHAEDIERCMKAGFSDHMLKPATPMRLLELISTILNPSAEATIDPSVLNAQVQPIDGLLENGSLTEKAEPQEQSAQDETTPE